MTLTNNEFDFMRFKFMLHSLQEKNELARGAISHLNGM